MEPFWGCQPSQTPLLLKPLFSNFTQNQNCHNICATCLWNVSVCSPATFILNLPLSRSYRPLYNHFSLGFRSFYFYPNITFVYKGFSLLCYSDSADTLSLNGFLVDLSNLHHVHHPTAIYLYSLPMVEIVNRYGPFPFILIFP